MTTDRDAILAEVSALIQIVLDDIPPDQPVTMDTTMHELGMHSLDLIDLAGRLQTRYPSGANFALFSADREGGSAGDLRVGQLVDFIADSLTVTSGTGGG